MPNINIATIVAIVGRVLSIGLPPKVEDEEELRKWVRKMVGVLIDVANMTDTELDDQAVRVIAAGLENDATWEAVYDLIKAVLHDEDVEPIYTKIKRSYTGKYGATIDPTTIMLIVKLVIEIINMFRRDEEPKQAAEDNDDDTGVIVEYPSDEN